MRLSSRARYAVRLMLEIAQRSRDGSPVDLREIAEVSEISRGYLEQVMISLRKAELVRGVSGRGGGYLLSRGADEITVGNVVEAAIGPFNIVGCVLHPESCRRSTDCFARPIWTLVNTRIRETLHEFTLADLSGRDWLERMTAEIAPVVGDLAFPEKMMRGKKRSAEGCPN